MVKAVFLDFYGTVVHEDGNVVRQISREISDTGNVQDPSEIGSYWWNAFQTAFLAAYGDHFETQRKLEYQSLNTGSSRPFLMKPNRFLNVVRYPFILYRI